MKKEMFGGAKFDYGWNVDSIITLWREVYHITVSAKAYSEIESVTEAQKSAYSMYLDNLENVQNIIEKLIEDTVSDKTEAKRRFVPRTLLIEKDGSYALLCDDADYPDDGVAICLSPQRIVVSQDAYL